MFDEFGGAFDEFGRRLEQDLGGEFGGDFDEFDEFWGHFLVLARKGGAFDEFGGVFDEFGRGLNRSLEMSLEVILMSLMSLGVVFLCVR